MGILSTIFERRSHPSRPTNDMLYLLGGGQGTYSGKTISENEAMSATAVFAAVRLIAETVASLPLILYKRRDNRGKDRATTHPIYKLMHLKPNDHMTSMAYREVSVGHMVLYGTWYSEIERDGNNRVKALWPLMPGRMTMVRLAADYGYVYTTPQGEQRKLKRTDVLRIPGFSQNGLVGLNPIIKGKQAIGLSLAAEEFGARFFGNNARPSAVLEHPSQVSSESADRLRKSWNTIHEGLENSHRLAILEEGMKLHEFGIEPEHAQFLETRMFQVSEIARIFNIPPHMLRDLSRSTNNNIEMQSLEFVIYCLRPWLVRIEQAMTVQLLIDREQATYFFEHLIDGLLRGDSKTRHEAYREGRQWGYYSANDIREMENKNPIKGGDTYLVPLNMIPADMVGVPAPARPAPEPTEDVSIDLPIERRSITQKEIETRTINGFQRLRQSYLRLLNDAAEQVVSRETRAIKAAVKKQLRSVDGFKEFLDQFFEEHRPYVRSKFGPVLQTYAEAIQAEASRLIGEDVGMTPDLERFIYDYLETFAFRHCRKGKAELMALMESLTADVVADEVNKRMDEWYEKKALKIAHDEANRVQNAVALEEWRTKGVAKKKWRTVGDNCPFCSSLNGKVIGIEEKFFDAGDVMYVAPDGRVSWHKAATGEDINPFKGTVEGVVALKSYGIKLHPPIHRGCDCQIVPVIE